MDRLHGFRTGFDSNEYASKGSPRNGKIGPGRSLYTDDFYDDEDVYFDESEDLSGIWDYDEFHIHHPTGQELVGDEITKNTYYGKGPKGYTRRDALIHEEVCESLKDSPDIDASEIDVTVDNGVVFLEGEVSHRRMKKEAEHCVENISGVKDVFNSIKVKNR